MDGWMTGLQLATIHKHGCHAEHREASGGAVAWLCLAQILRGVCPELCRRDDIMRAFATRFFRFDKINKTLTQEGADLSCSTSPYHSIS
jgi:hypothetical protein